MELLAIHILVPTVLDYYRIARAQQRIVCNNQGALGKSSQNRRCILNGSNQAEILWALRDAKSPKMTKMDYIWIEGYQYRQSTWKQPTLIQQQKCLCNGLSK